MYARGREGRSCLHAIVDRETTTDKYNDNKLTSTHSYRIFIKIRNTNRYGRYFTGNSNNGEFKDSFIYFPKYLSS